MRVVLSTYGSRGDVQPLVGLAVLLRALVAEVRVCAPPEEEFTELLARVGIPLGPALIHSRRQCWRLWLGVIHLLTQGIQSAVAKYCKVLTMSNTTNHAGSISLPFVDRFASVHAARLKQQGRRFPLFIFEILTSTRRLRVSGFWVALTQRTHSQRAIGVISFQRSWIF